jgi:hypothetical protein
MIEPFIDHFIETASRKIVEPPPGEGFGWRMTGQSRRSNSRNKSQNWLHTNCTLRIIRQQLNSKRGCQGVTVTRS